ncbi:MAG TPA: hypothetical protein VGB62_00135 [Allosphingosinicella sp.]|jgi:hypothetical protein
MTLSTLALTLAFLAAPLPGMEVDPASISPKAAAAKVRACGFEHVLIRYDRTMGQTVLVVKKVRAATKEQLECAARAAIDTVSFVLFPPAIQATYERLYYDLSRARTLADARAWLDKRGLLARLPAYDAQKTDQTGFARALDALCGAEPGLVDAEFPNSLLPLKAPTERVKAETFFCLLNAFEASGVRVGFVGNENHGLAD